MDLEKAIELDYEYGYISCHQQPSKLFHKHVDLVSSIYAVLVVILLIATVITFKHDVTRTIHTKELIGSHYYHNPVPIVLKAGEKLGRRAMVGGHKYLLSGVID